jgi:beta-phosphoglucomutase
MMLEKEVSIVQNQITAITGVIFDLDGVIVDTAHYHYLAWKKLAGELGINLTLEDNERLKGVSRMRSLEIILEIGGITLTPNEFEKLANKKNTWFVDFIERMNPDEIFPGVKKLIESLRNKGIRIALASSSKNAAIVLNILKIHSLFDTIVDGTMITHSKPDPEIFLLAAKRLNIVPEQCLVFEDAEAGVEAALRAGMRCVGVGKSEQLGMANIVIARTGDFSVEMWEQLNKLPAK